MPAGVSWPTYLKFFAAAMLSMMAGSQVVHMYYRPLDDMNELIEAEIRKKKLAESAISP
ncbi:protein brawnin [Chrysoperla carnea]|uniref:protein brawnin n=1 Tax=Chrysoperla carnea TaxID=189513 RepID=UPI001D061E3D|nr:protein brawnin [Chrysoperla carnea]